MPLRRNALFAGVAVFAAAAFAVGCSGFRQAVGAEKVRPDEFRIVTKAPLVIPPEYNVRPPEPGAPRPQELDAAAQARLAVLGQEYQGRASDGEQALVARVGGLTADPLVRATIDLENGGVVRKNRSFSDMLVFWSDGEERGTELNADAEAERLRIIETATGEGAEVTIRQRRGFKLPGL